MWLNRMRPTVGPVCVRPPTRSRVCRVTHTPSGVPECPANRLDASLPYRRDGGAISSVSLVAVMHAEPDFRVVSYELARDDQDDERRKRWVAARRRSSRRHSNGVTAEGRPDGGIDRAAEPPDRGVRAAPARRVPDLGGTRRRSEDGGVVEFGRPAQGP